MREVPTGDGKILHMPETVQRQKSPGSFDYQCDCHRRMGNDFWFLPATSCLRADNTCTNPKPFRDAT